MLDWLFPTSSNPGVLATIIGLRVVLNGYLTATIARAAGLRTPLTAAAGVVTLSSAVLTVLIFRPGRPGIYASYVEMVLQVALIGLVTSVLVTSRYSSPSRVERATTVAALVGASLLLLYMVPIYGDALVAP
ncbi:hypothetical protein [Halorussus litoreus]|uniref:hypothetical protein n=1 Tax=Halorussus litoreus TaxID=1710536 RepID=UPI001300BE61|nr:hypothetical protein [Halorussus litoreus]